MCEELNDESDIVLADYQSEASVKPTFYVGLPVEDKIFKPNKENPRKRKCNSYQYKVKRRAIDKIHLAVNSSEQSIPEIAQYTHALPPDEDDDDTEKYLTKSSKKLKQDDNNGKDEVANIVIQAEYDPLESSGVPIITNDFGEHLVVSFYSNSATNSISNSKDQQNLILNSTDTSYMKLDEPGSIFLASSFATTQATTQICTSTTTTDRKLIYTLTSDTKTIGTDEKKMSRAGNPKHKRNNSTKRKTIPAKLPASADLVDDPVRNLWVTSKTHKEQLKESGHSWTSGMWSKEEVEVLRANIATYCVERNISDPYDIIFTATKEERKDFYPTVSVGLHRPLFSVYRRIRRMYNKRNYKGKYSDEEINKLLELRKRYGNDWTFIAQQLGRSSDSVKDRCRLLRNDLTTGRIECSCGKWTKEEEDRLAEAVRTITKTEAGEHITDGIPWGQVADIVETRTDKQCRVKWLNYLNWKLLDGRDWTKFDDKLLVEKIVGMNVSSENEVDWNKLCVGWKSARSPQWLRGKWANLKKMLHQYKITNLSFQDIVQLLEKLFSEEVFNAWERPKQMLKCVLEEQAKDMKIGNPRRIKRMNKSADIPESEDSSNITTSVISQEDDTSSAPLFLQTTNPDHLMSRQMLTIPSSSATAHSSSQHSLNAIVRPRTSSESNQSKNEFELTCSNAGLLDTSDGPLSLPNGTYHLTPTPDGVFLIQPATSHSAEDVALTGGDERIVNITLAQDLLNSVFKLGGGSDASAEDLSLCQDASEVAYLSNESIANPVLRNITHAVEITEEPL